MLQPRFLLVSCLDLKKEGGCFRFSHNCFPDISKTQDEEVGDGTTTVCVLAGLLLEQAQELLQQHVHPQTICEGVH